MDTDCAFRRENFELCLWVSWIHFPFLSFSLSSSLLVFPLFPSLKVRLLLKFSGEIYGNRKNIIGIIEVFKVLSKFLFNKIQIIY